MVAGPATRGNALRLLRIALWLAAATFAGFTGGHLLMRSLEETETRPRQTAEEIARDLVTGEFDLVDHSGRRVSSSDFEGMWRLVFFGYTHCPDVCPTTMATVAQVLDELGDDAGRVQPLFITIDPTRDTPAALADYVAAFHPRVIGLTGSPEAVAAAARSFRVYFSKVTFDGDDGGAADPDYAIDHTAFLYLMDAEGRYAKAFSPSDAAADIAAAIRARLGR